MREDLHYGNGSHSLLVIVHSYEGVGDMTETTVVTVSVDGIGEVPVAVTERGQGRPFLLLHGGAGPQSVEGFADLLAAQGRGIVPVHPGVGGSPPPGGV